jgi:hypothetical protein
MPTTHTEMVVKLQNLTIGMATGEETLDRWKRADITGAAGKALAYLPTQSQIKARIQSYLSAIFGSTLVALRAGM